MSMNGVSFLVDDAGRKTGVVLDLRKHRRLWEDLYDRLLIESRRDEPRDSLREVQQRLTRQPSRRRTKAHG
jgi:hypothetical protein